MAGNLRAPGAIHVKVILPTHSSSQMSTRSQRYARFLLAVFVVGALLLPFAHEFTHIRSLEHRHGHAADDFALVAVGPGGFGAVDFLVEERTVPHNPNCDLCARLVVDVPPSAELAATFPYRDRHAAWGDSAPSAAVQSSRHIRAPPTLS